MRRQVRKEFTKMHAARRIGAVSIIALACASCSAGGSHVGFDDEVDAASTSEAGSFGTGSPRDAATSTADVSTPPPPPPPPPYDSGAPPTADSGPPVPCTTPLIDDMEHND